MTDQELEALRQEYLREYEAAENWAVHGVPYAGTWITELVGKSPPPEGSPQREAVLSLLRPGIVFTIFETKVTGLHPQYPDDDVLVGEDAQGNPITKKRSQLAAETLTALKEQLLSNLT